MWNHLYSRENVRLRIETLTWVSIFMTRSDAWIYRENRRNVSIFNEMGYEIMRLKRPNERNDVGRHEAKHRVPPGGLKPPRETSGRHSPLVAHQTAVLAHARRRCGPFVSSARILAHLVVLSHPLTSEIGSIDSECRTRGESVPRKGRSSTKVRLRPGIGTS